MARLKGSNWWVTVLTAEVDAEDTTLLIESDTDIPQAPFRAGLGDPTAPKDEQEIIEVTDVDGLTLTAIRGLEGTTGKYWPEGTQIESRWTAGAHDELANKALEWAGEWDEFTPYVADQVVRHEGNVYVALLESTGEEPAPEGTPYWDLVVPKGEQGPEGPQGEPGDPWNAWRGPWALSTEYATLDVVEHNGSAYVCTSAHTSSSSTEPGVGENWETVWDLLAAKGVDGDVVGPGSSTDSAVARWDGTGGNTIQDSVVLIGDTGAVSGVLSIAQAAPTELTIADGAVTVTQGLHTIDTEDNAESDDLVTINGGIAGLSVRLRAEHADRTVVLKHGVGNLELGGADVTLDDTDKWIELIYDGTLSKWLIVGGTGGGGAGDVTGPSSATAGNIAVFADTTGKAIADGGMFVNMETQSRTIYVDADNGSDTTGDGSSGAPFATYAKALSTVKGAIADGVGIVILCKAATNLYTPVNTRRILVGTGSLKIWGEFNQLQTGTADSGTPTTLTHSGAFAGKSYSGKMLYISSGTGAGQYRVILSHTDDTLTVVGRFDTTPDSTSVYQVLDWGTKFSGTASWYLGDVTLQNISSTNVAASAFIRPYSGSRVNFTRCSFMHSGVGMTIYCVETGAYVYMEACVFDGATVAYRALRVYAPGIQGHMYRTLIKRYVSTSSGCTVNISGNGSEVIIRNGSYLDGRDGSGPVVYVYGGASLLYYSNIVNGAIDKITIIGDSGNTYGLYAEMHGFCPCSQAVYITFSGSFSVANYGADNASYAYIMP